jgi:hypothetical protein
MSYAEAKNPILSVHLMQSYTTEMRSHQALKREILHNIKKMAMPFINHIWIVMTSDLSKGFEQFGHFRIRLAIRSSTQLLQKVWPHVLIAAFLKLFRQMVQRARVYL